MRFAMTMLNFEILFCKSFDKPRHLSDWLFKGAPCLQRTVIISDSEFLSSTYQQKWQTSRPVTASFCESWPTYALRLITIDKIYYLSLHIVDCLKNIFADTVIAWVAVYRKQFCKAGILKSNYFCKRFLEIVKRFFAMFVPLDHVIGTCQRLMHGEALEYVLLL